MRSTFMTLCFWLAASVAHAADEAAPTPMATTQVAANTTAANAASARSKSSETKPAAKPDDGPKSLTGMSILGNQEAPKALVIVPWKSSQLGDPQGISKQLDDGRQPLDKDVFVRELSYYDIRTGSK